MVWHAKQSAHLEAIAKTGFLVSVTSYLLFWGADLIEPGFVSRYFSVHLFLLTAVGFGIAWGALMKEYSDRMLSQIAVSILAGMILAILLWYATEDLGTYRILVSGIGVITPTLLWSFLRN